MIKLSVSLMYTFNKIWTNHDSISKSWICHQFWDYFLYLVYFSSYIPVPCWSCFLPLWLLYMLHLHPLPAPHIPPSCVPPVAASPFCFLASHLNWKLCVVCHLARHHSRCNIEFSEQQQDFLFNKQLLYIYCVLSSNTTVALLHWELHLYSLTY